MKIGICPNCQTRVALKADGTCPACSANVGLVVPNGKDIEEPNSSTKPDRGVPATLTPSAMTFPDREDLIPVFDAEGVEVPVIKIAAADRSVSGSQYRRALRSIQAWCTVILVLTVFGFRIGAFFWIVVVNELRGLGSGISNSHWMTEIERQEERRKLRRLWYMVTGCVGVQLTLLVIVASIR